MVDYFHSCWKTDQNTTREDKAFRVFHFRARFTIIICPPAGFFKFLMIHSKKKYSFQWKTNESVLSAFSFNLQQVDLNFVRYPE